MKAIGVIGIGVGLILLLGSRKKAEGAPSLSPSPMTPPFTPASKILVFGDSHVTSNLGNSLKALAGEAGIPFTIEGKGGSGAPYWRNKMVPMLESSKPSLVLISLGGNDFLRTDPNNVQQAITSIVYDVRSFGAIPVWLESPRFPFPDKIGVAEMWKASGAMHFPGLDLPVEHPATDKIHLSQQGYRDYARAIWNWLAEKGLV